MSGQDQSGTVAPINGSPGTDEPRDARRGRGLLRVLLAFFMVPVVMFSNPVTAEAAVGWQRATFSYDLPLHPDPTCAVSVARKDSGAAVWNSGWCNAGLDVSPGQSQFGEAGASFAFSFTGEGETGARCLLSGSGTLTARGDTYESEAKGTIPAGETATAADCHLTEVCLTLNGTGGNGSFTECQAIDLPMPDSKPDGWDHCVKGQPASAAFEWREGTGIYAGYFELFIKAGSSGIVGGDPLHMAAVARMPDGTYKGWGNAGIQIYDNAGGQWQKASPITPGASRPTIVGIQFHYDKAIAGLSPELSSSERQGPISGQWGVPQSASIQPYLGTTKPDRCRFYIGEKIASGGADPASNEPWGALNTEVGAVVDEPAPVEPVDDGPQVQDEPGFWKAILAVLKWIGGLLEDIGNLLTDLAAAIFGPIVDAIAAIWDFFTDTMLDLFVPADGYLDAKLGEVETAWGNTSPGKYVDAVQGWNVSGASGCQGIAFNPPLPGVTMQTQYFGAACSGAMANVAGLVRAVVSIGVVLGGGMAMVRAVGSGFGWDPRVGERVNS